MRLSNPAIAVAFSLAMSNAAWSLTHSRTYGWSFEQGNLVQNWSFENHLQFWEAAAPSVGHTIDVRYRHTSPRSGSYVGRSTGSNSTNGMAERVRSVRFPILPNRAYTLSFLYEATLTGAGTAPSFEFFKDRSIASWVERTTGTAYVTTTWRLYVWNFTTRPDAGYARLSLAKSELNGQGGTFHFDNVILQEGTFSAAEVQAQRDRISESVTFGDAFGRNHQEQVRLSGTRFVVQGTAFENFARPETTFLPVPATLSQPAFQPGLTAAASTFYNGTTAPASGNFPFTEVQYAAEPAPRVIATGTPGVNWRLGGTHAVKQGFFFQTALTILPANIESPAADAAQRDYRVDWTRDKDSNYTFTWSNRLGQVVQTALNITKGGTSANDWLLSKTQYEYYPNGQLKRVRTPLDVRDANLNFAQVTEFNTLGQTVSTYTKDKGLSKFWYNRAGQLRFSQDSGQADAGEVTYLEYDTQGRILSQGIQYMPTPPTQAIADQNIYNGASKEEQIGYIYDNFSSFQARTGFTLDQAMPYHYYMQKGNSYGKLVCQYNLNNDALYPGFSGLDNFVADFYDYDIKGRLSKHLKSIHPIRDPYKKFQDAYFTYDEADRLIESKNYLDASSGTLSSRHAYSYDRFGRVQKVVGLQDKPLAEFTYHEWGPLKQVLLGGDGTGTKGSKVEYFYQIQGWVTLIKVTDLSSGKITFQQFLGYEGKSNSASQVPNLIKPRHGGQVTQQLYKFASDINSSQPVRLVNYDYDELGRMITADFRKNSNATPLNADESINFAALTWNTTSNENDSYVAYDLNGRITGQRSANVAAVDSARYRYRDGTYKLDYVEGKIHPTLNRPMASPGTFVYDGRGRMYWDNSKQLEIAYGWDNLPAQFTRYSPSLAFQYNFYDGSGSRVSRFNIQGTTSTSTHYISMGAGNFKEWRETYGSGGSITTSTQTVALFANAQLGRIRADGVYEFFVKNLQGSTIKTVTDMGASGNNSYDYLAYGDLRKLKETGTTVSEKFTGKEYEDISGLYAFGARWFDPQLGLWMCPDKFNQFLSPYSYGSNPINGVDPDGNWFIIDDAIAAVIGAAVGAGVAMYRGYDVTDGEFWAYTAGGAAIGVASVYTAGAAAAAAGGGFAGAVAGGAAAGALGGAANYSLASGVETGFSNFSGSDLWQATWTGAAAGAVGGGVGSGLGSLGLNGAVSSFSTGFASGATGAALNGAEGWDIVAAGLTGGGIATAAYTAKWGYENYGGGLSGKNISLATGGDEDVPTNPRGTIRGNPLLREADADFREYASTNRWQETGESSANYQVKRSFWTGRLSVVRSFQYQSPGGATFVPLDPKAAFSFHSHPNANYPSAQDYNGAKIHFSTNKTTSYVVTPNGNTNFISPWSRNFYIVQF